MSRSFHLPDPLHFTTGTVGPPGQRVFYLQVGDGTELVSFKVEKQQVAALAEYLSGVLADLPPLDDPTAVAPPLVEPVLPEWTVGGIGIAVDEDNDRILLVVHELIAATEGDDDDEMAELLAELAGLELGDDDEEDEEDEDDDEDDEFDEDDEDDDAATARMRLTRGQVAAFIKRAGELVAAGRPLCPFCGLPSNPDGHICPREN